MWRQCICTVLILPIEGGGYWLAANRDELRKRSKALEPRRYRWGTREVLAPLDPDGGGTWLAVNEDGLAVTLLNRYGRSAEGGREETRKWSSRGEIVRLASEARDLEEMEALIRGILGPGGKQYRGFTLLGSFEKDRRLEVLEVTWDGERVEVGQREIPCAESSSSVESALAESTRLEVIGKALRQGPMDREKLEALFRSHLPERGVGSICMHREDGKTVSFSLVEVKEEGIELWYRDGSPCEPGEAMGLKMRCRK